MNIPKLITQKTLQIDTPNCLSVEMFLVEPSNGESTVLMQAWHWFEDKWHYDYEHFYFAYQSTACGFIADMSIQTASDWVKEYKFSNTEAAL